MQTNRRTFLVGLGRFAMGASALAIVKPRVLYSFPTDIRLASVREMEIVLTGSGYYEVDLVAGTWVLKTMSLREMLTWPRD